MIRGRAPGSRLLDAKSEHLATDAARQLVWTTRGTHRSSPTPLALPLGSDGASGNANLGRSDIAPSSDAGSIILRPPSRESSRARSTGHRALADRPTRQRRLRFSARSLGCPKAAVKSVRAHTFTPRSRSRREPGPAALRDTSRTMSEESTATPDAAWAGAPREYELAMIALQRTTIVLDQLRTRASVVLSGMAIVASFLGTRTEKHGTLVWVAFAILAFGMACCAGVLWPARDRRGIPKSANSPSKNTREDWWPFDRGARRFKSTITERDFGKEEAPGKDQPSLGGRGDCHPRVDGAQPEPANHQPSNRPLSARLPCTCCGGRRARLPFCSVGGRSRQKAVVPTNAPSTPAEDDTQDSSKLADPASVSAR